MFDVRIYGDPVLRKKALAVETFDDALREFVDEMVETMLTRDGVGLAAPQVNRSQRIIVIDVTGGEEQPLIIINPEIFSLSDDTEEMEEGCLSIPDIRLKVTRSAHISCKGRDITGEWLTIDRADGLLARALQHEIDHLDGILFVDRVSPLQRTMVGGKLKKLAKSHRGRH